MGLSLLVLLVASPFVVNKPDSKTQGLSIPFTLARSVWNVLFGFLFYLRNVHRKSKVT